MKDHDTHPDPAERWLRCGFCGYAEKCDPERYKDILNGNRKSPMRKDYIEDSRKIKK